MRIDEAIEKLKLDLENPGSVDLDDLNIAQELGIEALRKIQRQRHPGVNADYFLLPGETEE